MRSLVALLALVATAAALDLMEFKNGKTVAVEEATRLGMNLHVRYSLRDPSRTSYFPVNRKNH